MGNERGSPTGGGLNGAPERLAVTHQLIESPCIARDLGDRPVTDRSSQGRHIHLVEEVAERRLRRRTPELKAQRLGQQAVVTDRKSLQIPQAMAATQDSQHRHQQTDPLHYDPKALASAPPFLPGGLLNKFTVRAFYEAWYRKAPKHRVGELQAIAPFFHPLDGVQN